MRLYRRKAKRAGHPRRSPRHLEMIRNLCSERARLVEEVKQLSATVEVYKELLRRAENGTYFPELRADVAVS
jgi:hypothetical protein